MKHRVLQAACVVTLGAAVCRVGAAQQVPAVTVSTQAADTLPADPRVTVGVLENGLRYYIRANGRPEQRAELRLVVNAGSVLEDDDQRGLAHFVEHMAFNGTRHFPKQELVDYLELIGMRFGPDLNAFTQFDETVYMLTVPTDSAVILEQAFQILEDWAQHQLFDSLEIERERGVVLEEWRLGQGAGSRMRDKQLPILFRGSRYAVRLPIGERDVLETFDHEALKRYYARWYRPDLMAVVAVGDFDVEAIEGLIRQHFEPLAVPEEPAARPVYGVPDHEGTLFAIATDAEATNSQIAVYFKQALRPAGTVADYRQALVEALYNQMLSQRLFELTQTAEPPYLGAFSGQGRIVRSKEVYMLAALVQEGGLITGLEALLTEAERVARYGFAASELDRAKTELLRGLEQAYDERENTDSRMHVAEYLRHFLEGEPFPGIEYEFALTGELLPTIGLAEVNRLASEWITEGNRAVLVNAPEKEGLQTPNEAALTAVFLDVAARPIEPYEDAVADVPLVADMPAAGRVVRQESVEEVGLTIWELANGARVLLKPTDFKDDEILFDAWSPGGTSLAADESYVAATTAAGVVRTSGAGAFTLVELDKALAGRAASVRPYVSSLYEGLSGSASPQDIETLFQLIYLYVTAPRRDSTLFASYQTRIKASLENRSASPEIAFWDTVDVVLSQHHFRRRPPTAALYDEMDLDESLAFYRDRFADAGDFTFVFVGRFDPDSLRPLVEAYLGSLPSIDREESWRDEGIEPPTGVIRRTVQRGVEPKSLTVLAFTGGFEYTNENRYVLRSLDEVLQIRLRERLREDLGGTYGVGVRSSAVPVPTAEYSIFIEFGSAPERVEELVGVVFQQLDSLGREGPTDEELDKVKEAQRRARETRLRQNGFWLSLLLLYDRYGLELADVGRFEALVESLDARMIQEAARRYLRPDNYVEVTLYPETMN
jgi:zinc protease